MANYREVLNAIDEELAEKSKVFGLFDSTIARLLNEYLKEHPEKRDEAREIFYNGSFDENSWDWARLYLSVFNDKESCLKLLNDERYVFEEDVLKCNQEPEVVAKLLERNPLCVFDLLRICSEKKEEYKPQAVEAFYKIQSGELTDNACKSSYFFDIYKADTELWLELLNKSKFDAELCKGILNVCKDETVIDKILDVLSKQADNEKAVSVYDDIVRKVKNEDIYKRVLKQTDNKKIVNLMTAFSEEFSSEFQEELLHHPKLSYKGWLDLRKYMSESAFREEDIDCVLQNFDATEYSSYTSATVNKFFKCALEIRPTAMMAQKVFDYCMKISEYGKSYNSGEEIIFKIVDIDSSDVMFNRVCDYIVANGYTRLFSELLERRPTVEVLKRIDAYYKAYYKEKAKVKAQMKEFSPYWEEPAPLAEDEEPVRQCRKRRKRIEEEENKDIKEEPNPIAQADKEVLNTLKALMEFDGSNVKFAHEDFWRAAIYCNEKKILDIWKNYPTSEINALIENYLKEDWGDRKDFEATPEFYEERIKGIIDFIRDSELKQKLQRGETVKIQILTEQEPIDYIGYYKAMNGVWGTVIENSDDLKLLDKVVLTNAKIRAKALYEASRIKESYNKRDAKKDIERAQRYFEKVCRKKGYIRKKFKQLCPRLPFEKAVAKLFKQMQTTTDKKEKMMLNTILMAEGFDFYVDFIKNCEGKIDARIRDYVLKEKEKMIEKLPKYSEYDREDVYNEVQKIEAIFKEKNVIATTLKEKYPDLSFEQALIKEAARVVKSGDEKEKERFNNFLLAEGEERLLNVIDRDVCDYLFNNFSEQNLEEVNALRSFYGLKIIIDESPFEDPNLRTVRRMQFEDVVREPEPWSEYYAVQQSKVYIDFKADKRRKFKESDYYDMMDESEAIQVLKKHGYADFVSHLPEALANAHVPPEVAVQFNVKDLQAVFYEQLPDEEKDVYSWDGEFLFTKNRIEIEGPYDEDDLMGARASYWMDMVANRQLVQAMSDDFRRHNISERDIEQLFDRAMESGYPNAGRRWERVTSVILPLHHVLALKDKGLNYPNNYAPVVIYDDGHNSHAPLHWHDTPLDILYKVEGVHKKTDIMLSTKQQSKDAKQVRMRTVFIDDENDRGVKVLFYGGARKFSRHVGRLHDMENIALKAKALGKEQMREDAKMKALVQIVFKNAEQMIEQANERVQQRYNAKKRTKIEKRKQKVSRSKKLIKKKAVSKDNSLTV